MIALRSPDLDALFERFFRTGDSAAIEEAVRSVRPRLLAAARRIAGSDLAEDAVQGALLSAARRGSLPDGAPIRAWLLTATVRIAYRQRALARRERSLAERLASEPGEDGSRGRLERSEAIERTRAAVARLPARYRDVVVLHHLHGLDVDAVARLLDVPVETARTRLRRARALLRRRIGSPLLASAMLLAWTLTDLARPAAAAIGGTMKAKSLVLVAAAAVAGGAVSWVALREGASSRERAGEPPPLEEVARAPGPLPPEPAPGAPRLEPVPPNPALPAQRPPEPGPASPAAPVGRRAQVDRAVADYMKGFKVPAPVAESAKALGVADPALLQMYQAEFLLHFLSGAPEDEALRAATEESLAGLARFGDEGFRAVVANVQGNPMNTSRVDGMAKAVWRPGFERSVLDWARGAPANDLGPAVFRMLGALDTPEVRAFLRESLVKQANHASNFASSFAALAGLGEADDAEAAAPKLREPNWGGLRGMLLDALGRMGGPKARSVLVDYLRDPAGAQEADALAALARIDRAAALEEAAALLREGHPNPLTSQEAARVRAFLEGR